MLELLQPVKYFHNFWTLSMQTFSIWLVNDEPTFSIWSGRDAAAVPKAFTPERIGLNMALTTRLGRFSTVSL